MPPLAIHCRQLVKVYPPEVRAVDGLELEVREGECFGLLGPNGAGKTTTVEILEGLLAPTAGEVELLGRRWRDAYRELRQQIGISLQETRFPERLSVRETVTLMRSFYNAGDDPATAIELLGLQEKRDTWVGELSGGQRRRLEIACAIVGRPNLLFLDEPTTGLDPRSRRQVWSIIRRWRDDGRTVLLTTHYMDEAERLCDRVAIIDRGRVIAIGAPEELIRSLGGGHVIEFAVEHNGSGKREPLTDRELASLPGVRSVRARDADFGLAVSEPHVALPALLARLAATGRALTRLTTRHASLEDVFVHHTGRHIDSRGDEIDA